ncbi:hypothetical protein GCM10029992_43420 [Glycomyces albus]
MAAHAHEELFAQGVEWKPGARELLLEARAAGLPTALVTSTPRELSDLIIDQIGPDNFHITICGDEVEEKKPHPEPYLTAAAKLGVDITRSVVLEDSLSGVGSALAAGAVTLAVPSEVPSPTTSTSRGWAPSKASTSPTCEPSATDPKTP